MSASSCIVYYGVRYQLSSAEIEDVEARLDSRIAAARKAGLKFYWSNFGLPDERYLLFIGGEIGVLGPENRQEVEWSDADFESLTSSVRKRLAAANLEGSPKLYLHWMEDA